MKTMHLSFIFWSTYLLDNSKIITEKINFPNSHKNSNKLVMSWSQIYTFLINKIKMP